MELIFGEKVYPKENIIGHMREAADLALEKEGIINEDVQVSVSFVDMDEIKELNRIYREMDKVTDVLSFPQFEDMKDIPSDGIVSIGDVVICSEQALIQADEFGHSAERELVYLFVHSIFHLLGYNHMSEEEKSHMRNAEEEIMEKVNLKR